MHRHGNLNKTSALLLLLITLHVTVHSLVLTRLAFEPLQEEIATSHICSVSAGESDAEPGPEDYKPPKHSFVDYTTFFCPDRLMPLYQPSESRLHAAEPFRAPPQVYRDIFVPPQNRA